MKKGNSIRYSFTKQEDLNRVVERLGDLVHHVKIPEKQEGKVTIHGLTASHFQRSV